MNYFGFFGAILICWVWLEYLRRLDIFEPEKWKFTLLATALGAIFTIVLLVVISLPGISDLDTNGTVFHDFLFYVFRVGMLEEFAKIIPLFIMLRLTKEVDEPYDFLKYAMCSALGFATLENVMYFNEHGSQIIDKRAYISVVGHLSFTCCFAYGIVRKQMFGRGVQFLNVVFFGFLAMLLHGLFDLFLSYSFFWLFFVVLAYFLVIMLRNMINTALNFSPYFDRVHFRKIEQSFLWLFGGLIFVFGFACTAIFFQSGQAEAISFLLDNIIFSGTLIFFIPGKLSKMVLERSRRFNIVSKH
jgi:RsiW-degrading membrane proteinase PrsW (M82 family)